MSEEQSDSEAPVRNEEGEDEENGELMSDANAFKAPLPIILERGNMLGISSNSQFVQEPHENEKKQEVLDKQESPLGTISNLNEPSKNGDETEKSLPKTQKKVELIPIPLPYKEPDWGGILNEEYKMEVLKCGLIIDTHDLRDKSFFVVGRLADCDFVMEHPSVSRYHAVLQYRGVSTETQEKGFYLYDLGSTHGTYLNKARIRPNIYHRLHVGHMMKFGGSSRIFILQGPEQDQEPESPFTVTELIQRRKEKEELLKKLESGALEEEDKEKDPQDGRKNTDDQGIDWGMREDADETQDTKENPFAFMEGVNEELYIDDPKKTLRGWFEREGYNLEYDVQEKGFSHFICRVTLPIDTVTGESVIAEADVRGKKKEAVVQCALEACRILDRHGLLRQAKQESRAKKRKKDWEENDYYDSDEDEFLDRTGMIEQKRQQRMKKAGKAAETIETYQSLTEKLERVRDEIAQLEKELNEVSSDDTQKPPDVDELEAYMHSLEQKSIDKIAKRKLRVT
ncbi:unnamed protein product, partial [Darwinula stevensoni]